MAEKTILVDDITGEDGAVKHHVGLDGEHWRIDCTDPKWDEISGEIRKLMEQYGLPLHKNEVPVKGMKKATGNPESKYHREKATKALKAKLEELGIPAKASGPIPIFMKEVAEAGVVTDEIRVKYTEYLNKGTESAAVVPAQAAKKTAAKKATAAVEFTGSK